MNPEPRAPHPGNLPEAPQPPRKNSRPLVWAVAAGLGLLGIFGLLRSQSTPDATYSSTPASIEATPEVRLDPSGKLQTSSRNPLSDSFSEPQLIFFVPDDNGEMKQRTMPPKGDIPRDAQAARENLSMQAVQALMQAAPDIFPPGTVLQSVSIQNGAATLSFNSALSTPSFWQGSALTRATLDALAKTVAATKNQVPGDKGEGVRLSVEGKPLLALGEMDLSQPYTPSAQAPQRSEP